MELLLKRIDGEDELQERRLAIHHDTEILIGRASKTEQKQLVPAVDNGWIRQEVWIRNPAISRHHAVLTLEPSEAKPGVVFNQDKKSSHGTYVNGESIEQNKHPLHNGDKIRFGSELKRGEETFRPPVFSFETRQDGLASTYRLPEITVIEEANSKYWEDN
ncbi:hypothetical protein FKW77_000954 [Venturia effusa]|uniref:FHA domain-containing protein n=1 Tax=Venturia effusa TaxID=50376 RepID=A0A517LRH8_9PEZI|nr:hypothetical protein FKW77_000954 [Venturia effusa]